MPDVRSASPPAVMTSPPMFKNIYANMLLEKHGMHSDMVSVDAVNQLVIGDKSGTFVYVMSFWLQSGRIQV